MIAGGTMMLGGGGGGILFAVGTMMWAFRELGCADAFEPGVLTLRMANFLMFSTLGIFVGVIGFVVLVVGLGVWLATRKEIPPPLPG